MKFDTFVGAINNPVSKYFIKKISNKKTKSGKNLLEQYFYCYFSDTVSDDLRSFLNYKTRTFNFMMSTLEKIVRGKNRKKYRFAFNKIENSKFAMMNAKETAFTLKSIGDYGLQKPPVSGPLSAIWTFTNECKLKCIHCYQDAGIQNKDELTLEEKMNVVNQIVEAGCVYLTFSGGEPLMSKDFFKVAEYAREMGLIIRFATNGTLITKDVAKKLSELGFDYVTLSIDGAKKETHEKIRGVRGSYKKSIEAIKNCLDENITLCVTPVLIANNYNETDGIIELLKGMGVKFIVLSDFVPAGRGRKNADIELSPEIRHDLFRRIAKKSLEEKDIELGISSPRFTPTIKNMAIELSKHDTISLTNIGLFREPHEMREFMYKSYTNGCCAGRTYFAINPNGDIKPCVYMDVVVGNTRKDRIIDIWRNSEVLKSLRTRDDLKGNCGSCENKYICGGCRSRAWFYFKDLKAPDPACIKNVDVWNDIKR
jgi:radical SAM protein with 4Fe4S-binding SPASM domain